MGLIAKLQLILTAMTDIIALNSTLQADLTALSTFLDNV